MEHANSKAISIRSGEQLPNIAAHEFFHLWNVKRIRPATLEPVDYTKEQYTRALMALGRAVQVSIVPLN